MTKVTTGLRAIVTAPQAFWQPRGGGYWEGRWQPGTRQAIVDDPENGRVLGSAADATQDEVQRAVGYLADRWSKTPWPLWQRRQTLARAAERILAVEARFVDLISSEGVKTVSEARREVRRAAETLRLSAQASVELTGGTVPFDDAEGAEEWFGWYTRQPLGIVAAITPFNDPLNLAAHKLGPALIAGNAVILKPADSTPLTALALADVLLDCGTPPEYLAVVPGTEAGQALVADPRVDVVSFTGGGPTADRIAQSGPARKLLMELGGNNAVIACADACPQEVAESVVSGAFGCAGQNCLSVQRVYVARKIYADVIERVTRAAKTLVVGSKQDPETDVGPLVDVRAACRVESWIAEAVSDGATLHTGGERRGTFVTPAVLTDCPATARLSKEEVFGPVVVLTPFDDVEDAVRATNAVDTGLQAGIFTNDLTTAVRVGQQLRVGAVMVNNSSDYRVDAMPFGGFKRSGIGREGVAYAVRDLSAPRIVAVRDRSRRAEPVTHPDLVNHAMKEP